MPQIQPQGTVYRTKNSSSSTDHLVIKRADIPLEDEDSHNVLELMVPQHIKYKNFSFKDVADKMKRKKLQLQQQRHSIDSQVMDKTSGEHVPKALKGIVDQFETLMRKKEENGDTYARQQRLIKIVHEESLKFQPRYRSDNFRVKMDEGEGYLKTGCDEKSSSAKKVEFRDKVVVLWKSSADILDTLYLSRDCTS